MKCNWSVKLRPATLLGLLVVGVNLCGCGAISYLVEGLTPTGKGEWVAAENEALSKDKKVLILVYADDAYYSGQYQHADVRYETAAMVAEQMRSKLAVDVVDPAIVEQFQRSNPNWTDRHPSRIGRERYRADLVLYIELQEFTMTSKEFGGLLRGSMEGACSLFTTSESGSEAELWRKRVNAVYPPDMPELTETGAEGRVRDETMKLFAERVVKNFYGHYEPY